MKLPIRQNKSGQWQVTSDERKTRAKKSCHLSLVTRHSAFTLAEVLAALLFLAIVIPTAVEALRVASLSGEVAARKDMAARIADRVLNESLVTTNWNNGVQTGTASEGTQDFQWTLTTSNWPVDQMQVVTADVKFSAQGKDYSVTLSTLANSQVVPTPTSSQ